MDRVAQRLDIGAREALAEVMNTYEVTIADLADQDVAVVRGRVAHEGLGDFLASAFGEVMGAVAQQGHKVTGPPFARYEPTEAGGWDVEAGFPVSGVVDPVGRVGMATLPSGRAARTVHHGAYSKLGDAYGALESWVLENGYQTSSAPWEVYLDEPGVAVPRTEVFMPCAPAHH